MLQFLRAQPCLHFFYNISFLKIRCRTTDTVINSVVKTMCPSHPGFSELQTSTFPCSLNTTTPLTQRYTDCTKADQGHVPPFKPLTGLSVPTLPTKDCTLGQNDKTILFDSSFYAIQMHSVLRGKFLPAYKVSMVGVLHLSPMRTKHSRSFIYHLSAQNCQP